MKNTGIVRKIDELGRIVIPKEIRNNLNISNGEDIQIYIEEDKIILKKYQKMMTLRESSQKYINFFNRLIDNHMCISDKEKIIASTDKNNIDKFIDVKIKNAMNERKTIEGSNILIGQELKEQKYYILPIIIDASPVGSILVLSEKEISEKSKLIANVLNILLCNLII